MRIRYQSRWRKKKISKICVFYYKQKKRKNVDNRLIIMRRDSTRFATGIDANTQFLDLIFLIFATANDQVSERERDGWIRYKHSKFFFFIYQFSKPKKRHEKSSHKMLGMINYFCESMLRKSNITSIFFFLSLSLSFVPYIEQIFLFVKIERAWT